MSSGFDCSQDGRDESHAMHEDDSRDKFVQDIEDMDLSKDIEFEEMTYFCNLNYVLHHIARATMMPYDTPHEIPIERLHRYYTIGFYDTSKYNSILADQ
ncbi:hypothetical protein V6N11_054858 [Hibiscus sabdariffa]|uniref:Uncharacterized protein n=1 Tax=Hibiscus sabdariffa TaxID=183260 RepID=A0ABR2P347_9ROSI